MNRRCLSSDAVGANVSCYQLVAHSVATYARSFEGFPERTLDDASIKAADAYAKGTKYHGSKLFI